MRNCAASRVFRSRRASTIAGQPPDQAADREGRGRRLGLSTAFFSFATALSRVAGLGREIVAAVYFGVGAQATAFTIAFQIPNLVRALFADLALTGAFVPVFSELIARGERREAFRVASTLLFGITLVLGLLTGLFILFAPSIMPLFLPGLPELSGLTVGLSRLLFPIVLLLAISGLVVGMLNSFEHFSVPALAPLAWNIVIIAALVGLVPIFPEGEQIYAYAIGIVAGTFVQLVLPMPWLRGRGGRFSFTFDWRNPHVIRVLKLMLPVTLALGLINFSLVINSIVGSLVSVSAPAAIDKAFRIYMLPQGIFSIAIATILFPTLSKLAARGDYADLRDTMANGIRQMSMFLIPSAVVMAVLAEPIIRLVYQRGVFDAAATSLVSTALFWWALSLPFQGASLLYSRTFFSLQRPWVNTGLAGLSLVVNVAVSVALYEPLGVAGVVLGTVVATVAMTIAQAVLLRGRLDGIDGPRTLAASAKMLAAAALLGAVSYFSWGEIDALLGRSLLGQIGSVGIAIGLGSLVYALAVWVLRVPEAAQAWSLIAGRIGRR
ncbi:MAG: murein biosynthesis integral membrane protein MurJ [Thermoleophilaceae bacterium]|nr:murein biosynthesis integral membrane protein MurJ [Thermoleophilaceae bacterium]